MEVTQRYYRYKRSEMARFLPKEYSKVLEIGCGEGAFAENLGRAVDLWGVECDRRSAEVAARRMNTVVVGTYAQRAGEIPEDYFDLIVCNDVIEHMEDHDAFLDSIWSKLRIGGYLVGSIPNVRYLFNLYELLIKRDWQYRDSGILDRTHLRFFTKKSLLRTLSNHHFVVERIEGINRVRGVKSRAIVAAVYLVSLGYYADVQYLQFGVCARKANPGDITGDRP